MGTFVNWRNGSHDMDAGREVFETIVKRNPNAKVEAMQLDLSSLASLRKFAVDFKPSGLPLNILINQRLNIGISNWCSIDAPVSAVDSFSFNGDEEKADNHQSYVERKHQFPAMVAVLRCAANLSYLYALGDETIAFIPIDKDMSTDMSCLMDASSSIASHQTVVHSMSCDPTGECGICK
ncbi:hypothetical protein COLO4_16283 [Corchorus olitorius]|uniref:Uncharacterized protein n=1 Tax=Corchorus olitorius TaxID=93759 RepID=A0A1R3JII1_9ROSI|nr:hypothetical protein COLO4_16283 [Corchorus olitorius]